MAGRWLWITSCAPLSTHNLYCAVARKGGIKGRKTWLYTSAVIPPQSISSPPGTLSPQQTTTFQIPPGHLGGHSIAAGSLTEDLRLLVCATSCWQPLCTPKRQRVCSSSRHGFPLCLAYIAGVGQIQKKRSPFASATIIPRKIPKSFVFFFDKK